MQPSELQRIFGDNVKRLRQSLGLTQGALAVRLGNGFGHGYVSNVEAGKTAPTLRTIAIFSEALGVEPQELMAQSEVVA